ncbi:hypothetical protein GCM10012275_56430 [Longimycelium tulufanense]|uniref:Lysozyme n=1 Tax=Longimycelium tulufanense TaxID=907463 RepID=A0A8J3CJU9_9PSEU|nr:hypothetical protein GCM10012275_56430 [Longimycelium tulufanense]
MRLGAHSPSSLPPCLDIEVTGSDLRSWCGTFVRRLRDRLGTHAVLVYASTNFIQTHLGEDWANTHDVLWWVAHYGRAPGQPGHRTPRVVMHQYTSSGRVPGISGGVDMNQALRPLNEIVGKEPDLSWDETAPIKAAYPDSHDTENRVTMREFLQWTNWDTAGLQPWRRNVDTRLQRIEDKLGDLVDPKAIADALRPDVAAIVREVLGEDNADLADQIVTAISSRLSSTAS